MINNSNHLIAETYYNLTHLWIILLFQQSNHLRAPHNFFDVWVSRLRTLKPCFARRYTKYVKVQGYSITFNFIHKCRLPVSNRADSIPISTRNKSSDRVQHCIEYGKCEPSGCSEPAAAAADCSFFLFRRLRKLQAGRPSLFLVRFKIKAVSTHI